MVYPTRGKAIRDIALWIEVEYNQKLLHSTVGYRIAMARIKQNGILGQLLRDSWLALTEGLL